MRGCGSGLFHVLYSGLSFPQLLFCSGQCRRHHLSEVGQASVEEDRDVMNHKCLHIACQEVPYLNLFTPASACVINHTSPSIGTAPEEYFQIGTAYDETVISFPLRREESPAMATLICAFHSRIRELSLDQTLVSDGRLISTPSC